MNKGLFWMFWIERYPDTLSSRNMEAIDLRIYPVVDETWIH